MREFVEPYFSRGIGWTREVRERRVFVGPGNQVGWFDEISKRVEGVPMRTTGVVRRTDGQWKIADTQLLEESRLD